jgi:hypothetical protein
MGNSCILWCRADQGLTMGVGGVVNTWNDLSPQKNNLAGTNIGGVTNPIFSATDAPQPSHQMICNSADTAAGFFNVANPVGWATGTNPIHLWVVARMPTSWPVTHTIHGPFFDKNSTNCWAAANAADGVGFGINVISNKGTISYTYPGIIQAGNFPSPSLNNGQLYLLEYFFDGTVLAIWVNGTQVNSVTPTPSSASNANTLYIGIVGAISNRAFPGSIYELGAFSPFDKGSQASLQAYVRSRYRAW